MKMEEEGAYPPHPCRWPHQVRKCAHTNRTHTHTRLIKSLFCPLFCKEKPIESLLSVTVFTETLPSDTGDNMASQSVPMVTASTEMVAAPDDGDEVFMEQEGDG